MRLPQCFLLLLSVRPVRFLIGTMIALLGMFPMSAGATTPQLACTSSSLRFGEVVVRQTETLLVTVTNTGQTAVTISAIAASNSEFTTSNLDLPLVLPAGQGIDLNISFTPTAEGRASGNITFSSDASNPTLAVEVVGNAIADVNTSAARKRRTQTIYSISSQEPPTQNEYAGSPMGTALPSDAESHCLTNVACSNKSPDKAVIDCWFGGSCSEGTGGSETNAAASSVSYCPSCASGGGLGSAGTYYCSSTSCPIYKIVSTAHCPPKTAFCPTGKYFHLPNQAQWGSSVGGDNYLIVWDQSTDGSAGNTTIGGRRLTAYQDSHPGLITLPANNCFSESCAVQISLPDYADFSYPSQDTTAFQEGSGAWSSSGIIGSAGIIRGAEWVAGKINHAIILNTNCLSGEVYYPAPINAAKTCTDKLPYHVGEGMLVKIKNSFNCSNLLPYQQPLCAALKTYGGYIGDTSGVVCTSFTCRGVWPSRIEGGAAYNMAGIEYPFMATYLNGASGVECNYVYANKTPGKCTLFAPLDMTGLVTGGNLEIIDQCIVKRMAGVAGGC